MRLYYDLHLHSCLSPCGASDMTPASLVGMAKLAGFDVIALTDHNSARNCRAAQEAAQAYDICLIPGLELNTAEEVHVICLFPGLDEAEAFGEYVYAHLPHFENNPDIFGPQQVMNARDEVVALEPRMLSTATTIGTFAAAALAADFGGVAIPAHIDRSSFSLLSNLGLFDPEMGFSGVEITRGASRSELLRRHPQLSGLGYMINSDAHDLFAIEDARLMLEAEERSAASVIRQLRLGQFPHYFSKKQN